MFGTHRFWNQNLKVVPLSSESCLYVFVAKYEYNPILCKLFSSYLVLFTPYTINIMLSVLIVCTFEKDLCHWERQPENADSKYAWFRNTSEALESAGLQGPSGTVYILGQ